MEQVILISDQQVTPDRAHAWLAGKGDAGAVVTFTGHVRDEGGGVTALELEHFPQMAESETAAILARAAQRWPLVRAWVQHRVGRLLPGELIVLVGVASEHRQAAFEAAAFVMDFLKTRVPIWKKIIGESGDSWAEHRQRDAEAAGRWQDGED